jgi:hypothetical protein
MSRARIRNVLKLVRLFQYIEVIIEDTITLENEHLVLVSRSRLHEIGFRELEAQQKEVQTQTQTHIGTHNLARCPAGILQTDLEGAQKGWITMFRAC